MVSKMSEQSAFESLQSTSQRQLLDTIDKLRGCGLNDELSLPQLVVCGDQSAGKSSVLEALTEIDFPRADGVCTRFATEIIMRRGVSENLTVTINPDKGRPQAEQEEIQAFNHEITDFAKLAVQLPMLIDAAKDRMGIGSESRTFAKDILVIEITGPHRPQLTVVDLPGLFGNENQKGDKALVEELTKSYISKSRTICLAVISASYDADNQRILDLVREADPEGKRSLGIITKPDLPSAGSGSQKAFIDLASNRNPKYFFRLGWHVLKNRTFEEGDASFEQRNRNESYFFRNSAFKELDRDSVGIDTLRDRLSYLLFEHVKIEIPGLREETDKLLRKAENGLEALGRSRGTVDECRDCLIDIGEAFRELTRNALSGQYDGAFFESQDEEDFGAESMAAIHRLRALLQRMSKDFEQDVRLTGHTYDVAEEPSDLSTLQEQVAKAELGVLKTKADEPVYLSYPTAIAWARDLMTRNRGRELFGNYNPLIVTRLFHAQSKRWEMLAGDFVDQADEVCTSFVRAALQYSGPADVCNNVLISHIDETLKRRKYQAIAFLEKIMRSYRDHPINQNHKYVDLITKAREERNERHSSAAPDGSDDGNNNGKVDGMRIDMDLLTCADALDCTHAIYRIKQDTFVDVVLSLVVEEHIVSGLELIFTPKLINKMKDEEILNLASESVRTKHERAHLKEQVTRLKQGRRLLRGVGGTSI